MKSPSTEIFRQKEFEKIYASKKSSGKRKLSKT
jgi:hypothetical protein